MPLKNPPAIHRPTQRCPPCWGDKWKQQPPLLLPLQPPGLGGNVPPGFSPPSAVDPLAGGGGGGEAAPRSRGPGAGEARPGAALTSSTVSGMQIRYSFSSMVLPATDLRGGKRAGRGWGRPQSNKAAAKAQGWAPGAPCLEPVGEATPRAVRSVPGFLLSAREHVKV